MGLKDLPFTLLLIFFAAPVLAASSANFVAVKMLNPPAAPVAPVVEELRAAGVQAVFCRTDALFTDAAVGGNIREFRKLLADAGMQFFITAPVFCDPEAVKKDPGLMGFGSLGNPSKAEGADWLAFVCPTRQSYRKARIAAIARQLRELRPDGLSLDFIRYFIYWEKVAPGRTGDSLEKFCFCDHCLRLMTSELGLQFPAELKTRQAKAAWVLANHREKWTEWKCEKVTSMVRDTVAAAHEAIPGLRISLHGVPWLEHEYDDGRRVVAGQDLKKLAPYVDVFGPMGYFQMLQREPEWVHSVVVDYQRATGKLVLPAVQAVEDADAFRRHLRAGLDPPSAGINVFSWERLARDPEALKAVSAAASVAPNVRFSGARSSNYGIRPFPPPAGWGTALKTMSGYFPGSTPLGIWIVGRLNGRTTGMTLEFPRPDDKVEYGPLYTFSEEDKHEPYLKYFDEHGIKVFLQVEPGFADVNTAIDLVLKRYKQHPSVIGFGIDIEWFQNAKTDAPNGIATDELVKGWEARVKAHDPKYRLFVKHFREDNLPAKYRGDVVFVDDSQQFDSVQSFSAEFQKFAANFYPNLVLFQIGYRADKKWWGGAAPPIPKTLGEQLAAGTRQDCGIVWVDFSLRDVVPTEPQ
jgi:hypothetical protein